MFTRSNTLFTNNYCTIFFLLNWINDNQITHINEQNGHSNIMCIAVDIVNEMTQMILELNIFWWVIIYGDDDLQ